MVLTYQDLVADRNYYRDKVNDLEKERDNLEKKLSQSKKTLKDYEKSYVTNIRGKSK